jgi:hypothetical protein
MIAFTVIVGDEFGHCPAKMEFTEWDHLVQAFLLERTDKPLRVSIAVRRAERRLHDSHTPWWTAENRPLFDTSKPATTGVASETVQDLSHALI